MAARGYVSIPIILALAVARLATLSAAQDGVAEDEASPALGGRWNGGCLTPDQEAGTCITVVQCPPLVALLRQRPVPPESVQFLRRSQCGFQGTVPLVCCPNTGSRRPPRPNRLPNNGQVWPNSQPTPRPTPRPTRPTPRPTQRPTQARPNKLDRLTGGHSHPNARLLPENDCGSDLAERIFGGNETDLGEFPWMALLQYRNSRGGLGFYCGGVLISKRYVLTAAHCLAEDSVKLVSVRLGEHDTKTSPDCRQDLTAAQGEQICADPAVDVPVEREISYPEYRKYDNNHYNDIALVRLSRDVSFTGYVKPICLPLSSELSSRSYVGKKLWVAGWGKTETRSESDVKLKLAVPVVSNQDCAPVYRRAQVELSDHSQLCAGGQSGKDSCNGDSGGPLMSVDNENGETRWYATGVVAFGPVKCGMEGWPGVYTRVAHFLPWILDNLND